MAKKSKPVDNRVINAGKVVRSATTHKHALAEALAARAIAEQGPETKVTKESVLLLIDFLVATVNGGAKRMDEADLALTAERADDVPLRAARDKQHEELVNRMVRVRSSVTDALSSPALATYGLEGATPRLPRDIASHAWTVVKLMKEKPFHVVLDGVTFDSAGIVASIEANAAALEATLHDIEREDQELVAALGKRDKAATAFVDDYQGVADTLTGLFRLAGRKDLAEHVRPTSRVLSGEEVVPDEPSPAPAPEGGATNAPAAP